MKYKYLEKLIKRVILPGLTAIALMIGVIAGYDQIMAKYATAKDVRDNAHDLGRLIELQKLVIVENRREFARRRIDIVIDKMDSFERQNIGKTINSAMRSYYEGLKQEKIKLEGRLK